MIVTRQDVLKLFEGIISGSVAREDADVWAASIRKALDLEQVEFNPAADREVIMSGVRFLHGIDLRDAPDEYLHSLEDIEIAMKRVAEGG